MRGKTRGHDAGVRQGEGMNQTRPKSSRAILHGRALFPGLLPLHGRRRSEHTHTQIKSTNKIYLCAHTHTHTVADEDDEGGGRRGWPEVISRRRGCDGDDDDEAAVDPINQIWARARMMAADLGPGAAHEWERREPGH